MKNLKFFFAALVCAAMTFVACDNETDPIVPPTINPGGKPTMPEVAEVEGAYVIVAQFQQKPCNDVILAGSYKLADGSQSAWGKEPAAKFLAFANFSPSSSFSFKASKSFFPINTSPRTIMSMFSFLKVVNISLSALR